MSLRRLLGLPAAVSGRLSRSLSTSTGAYSRPPWILLDQVTLTTGSAALGASVRIAEPPRACTLTVPSLLVDAGAGPDPDSDVTQLLIGRVCSTSADGLLFLIVYDLHATAPILAKQGANHVRQLTGLDPGHTPDITRFLCNPLTAQLTRLPAIGAGREKFGCGPHMSVLTQSGRAHGDPGRLAVAELQGNMMVRFLSDTARWEVADSRSPRPDLSWGAISAGPFSDRPGPRFVELPRGSVVPARPERAAGYRRMGVSEGRVRYAEVWEREPFVLSSYALDDEGGGWTLDTAWCSAGSGRKTTPQIGALDPLNGNVIYLTVGMHIIGVDMSKEEVIGCSLHNGSTFCVPCVLPPSLESSRIHAAGNRFNCY
ncbi:hypothetical protein VPH35_115679 [Triticum aestivum]